MIKRWILLIIICIFLLAGCASEGGTVGGENGDTAVEDKVDFGSYNLIVITWDTPQEVIDELESGGYPYTKYYDGMLLSEEETAALGEHAGIYLCEGVYEVDAGSFIRTDCSGEVLIQGAGSDKTILRAYDSVRKNQGVAVKVTGTGQGSVTMRDFQISGFQVGIQMEHVTGALLENLLLEKNRHAGIQLNAVTGSRIDGCTIRENGEPGYGDIGYGLMLDGECFGNSGKENSYLNNGNYNAVDYPCLWTGYTDNDNSIEMTAEYTLTPGMPVLRDPDVEARNARPGEDSLRYEAEEGGYYGASVVEEGKMPEASGGQYMFLADGALFFRVNVPKEGYYRLFAVGGSDDGNSKCDKISVNGGQEYLLSFPWQGSAQWQLSQPGLEAWTDNVLTPEVPAEGFWFQEGENMITVVANWGYCAYDCIYLEEIPGSEGR